MSIGNYKVLFTDIKQFCPLPSCYFFSLLLELECGTVGSAL